MVSPHYEPMDEKRDSSSSPVPPVERKPSRLVALFGFYWKKFLYKTRVIEYEEGELEKRLRELESEVKIKKMRNKIDTFS